MASFIGHAVPGFFFIIHALWWAIRIFGRFYESLCTNGKPYCSTATFKFTCLPGRLKHAEIEGFSKMLLAGVGIIGAIFYLWDPQGSMLPDNLQHATMFFFFGIPGFIDLLYHYKVTLPPHMDYLPGEFALVVEGILFSSHLHNRSPMDVQVHIFLIYIITANLFFGILEMVFRSNAIWALLRAYCFLVHGIWFWVIGFLLFNPLPGAKKWDEESHSQMMVISVIFIWVLGCTVFIMVLIGYTVRIIHRRKCNMDYKVAHAQENDEDEVDEDDVDEDDEATRFISNVLNHRKSEYNSYLKLLNDDIER